MTNRNDPSAANGHVVLADRVFDGHGWHAGAALLVRAGRIVGLGSPGDAPSDWPQTRLPAGAFLAPGFIDLQVNGGGGVLLNDRPTADGMCAIARAHRRYGTTACLPTLITDTREQMRAPSRRLGWLVAGKGSSACISKGPSSVRGVRGSIGSTGSNSLTRVTLRNCANLAVPEGR